MLKRLLSIALAFVLVLGITGGVSAQEQNIDPIDMVDYLSNGIYGSGVITSPSQEMWFRGTIGYHDGIIGIYDPTESLALEVLEEPNAWVAPYVDGFRTIYTWVGGNEFHIKVTYEADKPFKETPFHVFITDGYLPDLPELPEVPNDPDPENIYFPEIYYDIPVGDTIQLTPVIRPDNANKSLTWSSSNTGAASVNTNGLVTANSVGMAFITATTVNGLTAQCIINVVEGSSVPTHTVTIAVHYLDGAYPDDVVSFQVEDGASFEERYEVRDGYRYVGNQLADSLLWGVDPGAQLVFIDRVEQDISIRLNYERSGYTVKVITQYGDGTDDKVETYTVNESAAFEAGFDVPENYEYKRFLATNLSVQVNAAQQRITIGSVDEDIDVYIILEATDVPEPAIYTIYVDKFVHDAGVLEFETFYVAEGEPLEAIITPPYFGARYDGGTPDGDGMKMVLNADGTLTLTIDVVTRNWFIGTDWR